MNRTTRGLVLVSYLEELVLDVLRDAKSAEEELGPIIIGRRSGLIPNSVGKSDSRLANAILGQLERKGLASRIGPGMGRWVLAEE